MPPKRTSGADQLPLPAAVKLDRYGLHARDCECTRCALGNRPSESARNHARWAFERRERAELEAKAKGEGAPAGPGVAPAEVKHRAAHERRQQREQDTREYLERMRKPVERPATPDELAELRKMFGLQRRKER